MFSTRGLWQACRITLFTRDNCGLCAAARDVLSQVGDKRPFVLRTVDLAQPGSRAWRELYFDIPVVCCHLVGRVRPALTRGQIHISKEAAAEEQVATAAEAVKLMHRFTPAQVEARIDEVLRRN